MYYEVIPTKLFRADSDGILTYGSEISLKPGQIVEIPLGRSKCVGIIKSRTKKPAFPVKPIIRVIYDTPVPPHIISAITWLSQYYLCPLPQCASLFLPQGVEKSRRKVQKTLPKPIFDPKTAKISLNPAQKQALETLQSLSKPTKLLHGVTGSGKTNIYLKTALDAFKRQKSTILLVPEIALTSQLVQIFERTFPGLVITLHSRQTEATRHQIWENILTSDHPLIIIGPRSALLTPVKDLGAIIVDEAHESSYFQENPPKYSALRLASFIAQNLKISCIFGSATPLVSDYYLAEQNHSVVTIKEKAKTTAITPVFHVIDLKNKLQFTKNRYFSNDLLNSIKTNLENHHQTLIFHNRRGSAPLTICKNCGWQALCPNCYLPLSLHTDSYQLICHVCGYSTPVPHSCPDCRGADIIHKGFGTKLLEHELTKLFPEAKIARFDADNRKNEGLDALYQEVKSGDFDIIIGTQTIAKGLDLPLLATVGVVQADSGLALPDFTSEERVFQLLTQVIGRVGRGHIDIAEVFLQTYQPDHPVINSAIQADYAQFYQHLLKTRHKAHFPPFSYLAKISVTYKSEATVVKHINSLHQILQKTQKVTISNPTPAFHEYSNSGHTWQLILKSTSRAALLSALKSLPKSSGVHITIDPPTLL